MSARLDKLMISKSATVKFDLPMHCTCICIGSVADLKFKNEGGGMVGAGSGKCIFVQNFHLVIRYMQSTGRGGKG